ncbi:MAG: hypothetical protein JWM27_120 [Gemmatimonadetes bacterium]|nr:hypothetical protein [Gemmatimonadota bacterium]
MSGAADAPRDAPVDAYRARAVVGPGGTVAPCGVPFDGGTEVEVVVFRTREDSRSTGGDAARGSLRGAVLSYDAPTEPAWPADPDAERP